MENRKQMKDGRIGHYGRVSGGKAMSMEDRKKNEDDIREPANQNDVLCLSCQRNFNVVQVKRDRTREFDRVHVKISRGSEARCASNPRRDPAERGWKLYNFKFKRRAIRQARTSTVSSRRCKPSEILAVTSCEDFTATAVDIPITVSVRLRSHSLSDCKSLFHNCTLHRHCTLVSCMRKTEKEDDLSTSSEI
ncbi:hypothetical protein NL676_033753 [Syzygium grande]|nr:hypothetical protein NL676_033753 [Syzygium grande]